MHCKKITLLNFFRNVKVRLDEKNVEKNCRVFFGKIVNIFTSKLACFYNISKKKFDILMIKDFLHFSRKCLHSLEMKFLWETVKKIFLTQALVGIRA